MSSRIASEYIIAGIVTGALIPVIYKSCHKFVKNRGKKILLTMEDISEARRKVEGDYSE